MHMVWSRDGHGIDVLGFLFQHLAPIKIKSRIGARLKRVGSAILVGVANSNNFLTAAMFDVASALPTGADTSDAQFLVAAKLAWVRFGQTREGGGADSCQGGVVKELPTAK